MDKNKNFEECSKEPGEDFISIVFRYLQPLSFSTKEIVGFIGNICIVLNESKEK